MKLPKSVRVAHMDFEIVEWKTPAANASHKWGEFSVQEQLIRVQVRDRQFWEVVCTLLHEIGHAIFWAYEIREGDKEERIVGVFATGWTQIYRDNPELIAFIESKGAVAHVETIDEYATRKGRELRDGKTIEA